MRVRAYARLLAVGLATCGIAGGALAQDAGRPSVAEARWDARLSVRLVPPTAAGALRLGLPGGGTDQEPAAPSRTRVFVSEVIVGALGSAGGAVAGVYAGRAFCERTSPCDGEDPGLLEGLLGAMAGSIVGTALGTHVGALVVGGRGGHFGERLGGALIGILAGAGAFKLAGGDADQTLALAAFPIAQSLVTVLLTPRD